MKLKILACLFLLFAVLTAGFSQPEMPMHLTADSIKDGQISLNFRADWRFRGGDDLRWADPDFQDSTWLHIAPHALPLASSDEAIWDGTGWWRLRFTADSAVMQEISRLHFRTWGAAEVYLDGKLSQVYGRFSSDAAAEINFVPRYAIDKPIRIEPRAEHVLAVRFSHHHARKYQSLLKHNAPPSGFSMELRDEKRGVDSANNHTYAIVSWSAVTALLLLLLLLHFLLFYKFPKDNSNLVVCLVIVCFLLSVSTNFAQYFFHITAFRSALLRGFFNSIFFGLGIVLLPYALSIIFRLSNFRWTKYLFLLVIVRSIFYFAPICPIIIWDALFIIVVFGVISFLMSKAIKIKLPDVHFVTIGALGTTIFLLIDRLYATNVIALTDAQYHLVFVLVFICFPVGLSVYITSRYGSLFSSMEKEVANRTADLNESLQNLQVSQVQLTAKNSENVLLLKEIHHRVKNNLQTISSLLSLQSAHLKDDSEVRGAVEAGQHRVQSMALIHQKLYQRDNLAAIEMRDYLTNLGQSLFESYGIDESRISLKIEMPELELDVDTAVPIGLIVNELVTNSLKYAFPDGRKGVVEIALKKSESGLELRVEDDGAGLSKNEKSGGSFGSRLVKLLAMQLGGTIEQGGENGFWTRLRV